jgi:hypothetical protein
LIATRRETLGKRVGVGDFSFGALPTTRELAVMLGRTARIDLSCLECRRGFDDLLLGFLNRCAKRVGRGHRVLSRVLGRDQFSAQRKELRTATQRAWAGRGPRQPNSAASVRECGAIVDRVRVTKQRAYPRSSGTGRVDTVRECVGSDLTGL